MNKSQYDELMKLTFKGTFMINTLTKLLSNEISPEEYKKLILEKKSEISSKNKSLTEDQKYDLLMRSNDIKTETVEKIATSSNKISESDDKKESLLVKKNIKNNLTLYYIIIAVGCLYLSIFLTALNVKFGKPVLVAADESISNEGDFRILKEVDEKNIDMELSNEQKDFKLNLNKHSLLITPKMKKVVLPTFEGLLGIISKYGLSVFGTVFTIFGRFIDGKNIRWLKIRLAIIFTLIPIVRVFLLNKMNNEFLSMNKNQDMDVYRSKEFSQYNPKNLNYNLYIEIAHSFFSIFLALNNALPFVVEAFYSGNSFACESIKKLFNYKNKKN